MAEVSGLSEQIDVAALRDYRDAVGQRTREVLGGFDPTDLEGAVTAEGMQRAATRGAFGERHERMLKITGLGT